MTSSTSNGSQRKRRLDCFEILQNCEYASIESVCISIQEHSREHVDHFMDLHYLQNDDLLCRISEILRDCIIDKASEDIAPNQPLTAALLLILPFINCSAQLSHDICQKYVSVYDRKENNNFCRGLVFALSWKVSIISLQTKTWIMCSLCHLIETQHALKISSKIKDAYNGLVRYSLQILQCQFLCARHINISIKQYAIRILLCELNEGVMARQYLKDQYTNLIVLQSIIMLHEAYECWNKEHTKYNEYQWLMLKLFQFLYESFDFDDLWMSLDEYKHKTMVDTCKQKQKQKEIELNDAIKSHYLRSYLMTRCQFGRLLQMKCKLFLNSTKGIVIRVACKLLLEYPLNDKYGLCSHSPSHLYSDHHINKTRTGTAADPHPHHTPPHNMAPSQSQSQMNNNYNNNVVKNRKNKATKSSNNKQKKGIRSNKHKTGKQPKPAKNNYNKKQKNKKKTVYNNYNCSNPDPDPDPEENGNENENNVMNDKKRSYSGPNWHYEFQRLLKNEEDWNNESILDPQLKLKLFYCY